jgi:NAD+ kinase
MAQIMKLPQIIGITVNYEKPQARKRLAELVGLFEEHGITTLVESRRTLPLKRIARRADMIVVLGGDGTMLRAARELDGAEVPLLGINLGRLGFLTSIHAEELEAVTHRILHGHYRITKRHTLVTSLWRRGRKLETHHSLNDAVISRGAVSRVVCLAVTIDGERLTEYTCDGIIFATATGSTAYSLSAGGPILLPTARACVLTPICPHTLSNRSVIAPENSTLRCRVISAPGGLLLTVDGQVQQRMQVDDEVEVRPGPHMVHLVTPEGHEYFDVLRQKLKWSGSYG